MLRFSTKIYVKEELTNDVFIDMVLKWATEGQHYTFGELNWNGNDEYYVESSNGLQTLEINKFDETVIVHLTNKDGKIIWTNDYVLTVKNGKRVLSVQLYNDALEISAKMPNDFNRPYLLKLIIREGYGDKDNGLLINDRFVWIKDDNIELIEKIILEETEYMMPVVYVTQAAYTDNYRVNYYELAKDLAGIAHVLVEKERSVSKRLQETTCGKNPYNSAVQIYFGKGASQRILYTNGSKWAFRKEIVNAVCRRLCLSKIDDDLSWSKIRFKKTVESMQKNETYNEELIKVFEDELDSKDFEIERRNKRIDELEQSINVLESQVEFFRHSFEKKSESSENADSIILDSQEFDFFDNEQTDIILKLIRKELNTMESDPNQKESRKYHVLKSIVQQNIIKNDAESVIQEIRNLFSGDAKINSSFKSKLKEMGFEINDGGKHYELSYRGDNRYSFTLSRTTSDGRSFKNMGTKILKNIFGVND